MFNLDHIAPIDQSPAAAGSLATILKGSSSTSATPQSIRSAIENIPSRIWSGGWRNAETSPFSGVAMNFEVSSVSIIKHRP
jgi:hypothetical protein